MERWMNEIVDKRIVESINKTWKAERMKGWKDGWWMNEIMREYGKEWKDERMYDGWMK